MTMRSTPHGNHTPRQEDAPPLDVLREITRELPALTAMVKEPEGNNYIEYEVDGGTCFGLGLYHCEAVAVQRSFVCAGTLFPLHTHPAVEHLIVYTGELAIQEPDHLVLKPGDSVRFPAGVAHSVLAVEDSWMIGIVVPSEDGYP